MLPHVKVLYRTIASGAEHALVLLKGDWGANALRGDVSALMTSLGIDHNAQQRCIQAASYTIRFASADPYDLCGVRGDIVFARLSEWTEDEINTVIKPMLAGGGRLHAYHLARRLIKRGLMTEDECYYPHRTIDHLLINLD
jgi:hypothetical protein